MIPASQAGFDTPFFRDYTVPVPHPAREVRTVSHSRAALPDLELEVLRLSTGDLTARLLAEKDNPQADVIWGTAATSMIIFNNEGMLEPYAPKGVEDVLPQFKDAGDPPAWVGVDAYLTAFCFNTQVAEEYGLPKPTSWEDLLDPVYEGHIVMPNPASSGTGFMFVSSVLQGLGEDEGWEYLPALDKNMAIYKVRLQAVQDGGSGRVRHRHLLRLRGSPAAG